MPSSKFGKKQKPLFVIDGPIKVAAYRSNFRAFEATKFLDRNKLKKTRKVSLEIGTIEAAGQSATLVAEIEKGMITGLSIEQCANCTPKAKLSRGQYRKLVHEIAEKARATPGGMLTLPTPLTFAANDYTKISIGPLLIVFGTESDPGIFVAIGDYFCVYTPSDGLLCDKVPD